MAFGANVVNIAGECYSALLGSTLSPNVTSTQGTADACGGCDPDWECINCLAQCFSSAATVTLTWEFAVPETLVGTGDCLSSFDLISSGSITAPYENFPPPGTLPEFPSNQPIFSATVEGVRVAIIYSCPDNGWHFTIADESGTYGLAAQTIWRGSGSSFYVPPPQDQDVPGNACGAVDDGIGAYDMCIYSSYSGCPAGAVITGTFSITVNNNTDCCYDADAPGGAACLADIGVPCPSPDCSGDGG